MLQRRSLSAVTAAVSIQRRPISAKFWSPISSSLLSSSFAPADDSAHNIIGNQQLRQRFNSFSSYVSSYPCIHVNKATDCWRCHGQKRRQQSGFPLFSLQFRGISNQNIHDNSQPSSKTTAAAAAVPPPPLNLATVPNTANGPGFSVGDNKLVATKKDGAEILAPKDNKDVDKKKKTELPECYPVPKDVEGEVLLFYEAEAVTKVLSEGNNTTGTVVVDPDGNPDERHQIKGLAIWMAKWQGVEYTIAMAEGTPVNLCRVDPIHGLVKLDPSFQAMDELFPIAQQAVQEHYRPSSQSEQDGKEEKPKPQFEQLQDEFEPKDHRVMPGEVVLERNPHTLTINGEGWLEDVDDLVGSDGIDEEVGDNSEDENPPVQWQAPDQVLLEFVHQSLSQPQPQRYVITRPSEPFVFVGKPHPSGDKNKLVLLTEEEAETLGPLLEEAPVDFLDAVNAEAAMEKEMADMSREMEKLKSQEREERQRQSKGMEKVDDIEDDDDDLPKRKPPSLKDAQQLQDDLEAILSKDELAAVKADIEKMKKEAAEHEEEAKRKKNGKPNQKQRSPPSSEKQLKKAANPAKAPASTGERGSKKSRPKQKKQKKQKPRN